MKNHRKNNLLSFIALIALLVGILILPGCTESAVLEEIVEYTVDGTVHSLNIKVNAAELVIRDSEAFFVESNLKYLTVHEENGILTITEETKLGSTYESPILVLHMPTDTLFEQVHIQTGAGKLTAGELNTSILNMTLGAGDLSIANLRVTTDAKINGGAGKITVSDGSIKDLELEMGIGELNLAATLIGNSDLSLGVGTSNIHLLGGREIYKIDIEKGLGQVTIDGIKVEDFGVTGTGNNSVDIEGGVGNIHIRFSA